MNTPKKIKRHTPQTYASLLNYLLANAGSDNLIVGLHNPSYALALARIVTEFEHLEDRMADFFAELAGTDFRTAAYILRAIKAPRGRIDVMQTLLEAAERNKGRGQEYDQVIDEFAGTAKLRNTYVHGRWWTSEKTKRLVLFAPTDEHSLEIIRAQQVRMTDLNYVLYRINRTTGLVVRLTGLSPEQRAQLPEPAPLKSPPAQGKGHQQTYAQAPPGLPQSLLASPRKKRPRKEG